MRTVADMDGAGDFATHTDKGRRYLKDSATFWLATMRKHGLVPIIVPKEPDAG